MLSKKLLIFLLVLLFSASIVYSADNSTYSNDTVNSLEESISNQNINSDIYEKNTTSEMSDNYISDDESDISLDGIDLMYSNDSDFKNWNDNFNKEFTTYDYKDYENSSILYVNSLENMDNAHFFNNNTKSYKLNFSTNNGELFKESNTLSNYISTEQKLPEEISFSNNKLTTDEYIYQLLLYSSNNTLNNITYSFNNTLNKTMTGNNINILSRALIKYYTENNKFPKYVITSQDNLKFVDTIYLITNSLNENNKPLLLSNYPQIQNVIAHNYEELEEEFVSSKNYDITIITLNGDAIYNVTTRFYFNNTNSHKEIIINGNNRLFTGMPTFGFVIPKNYDVTFNNIKILNYISNRTISIFDNKGNLTIANSNIQNNTLRISGGLIFNEGNLTLRNNTISKNQVKKPADALSIVWNVGNVTLEKNEIKNNRGYGFTIVYNNGENTHVNFITNRIVQNTALDTVSQGHTLDSRGSVVYNYNGNIILYNNKIYSNTASNGTVIYSTGGRINFTSNNINNNSAKNSGGVIEIINGSVNMDNNFLYNSYAGSYGGVLFINNTNVSFYNNSISSNVAGVGAVICNINGKINLTSNNINNNSAKNSGGVIENINGSVITNNNSIYNSVAENDGGFLFAINGAYYSINDTIKYSKARDGATMSFNDNSVAYIVNTNISNCTALAGGAAIYSSASVITLNNTKLYNNKAFYGGVFYVDSDNIIIINNTTLTNNQAKLGGVIYNDQSILYLNNSDFQDNYAHTGGGIYSTEAELHIENTQFKNNEALFGGAVIQLSEKQTIIESSIFKYNNATDGGALYISNSPTIIDSTNFIKNIAGNQGGAIYLTLSDILSIENSIFLNNHAKESGSTIKSQESTIEINNNAILNNNTENELSLLNTYYDIEYNWWGVNTPDYKIITNSTIPEKWIILTTTNTTNTININLNTLNNGNIYNSNITRSVTLITDKTSTFSITNSEKYTTKITTPTTIQIDNEKIIINKTRTLFFYANDITAHPGDKITQKIFINKDYNGKSIIKINGKTLKDTNNNTIYFYPKNGVIIYNFTIPSDWSIKNYTINYVIDNTNTYSNLRINKTLILEQGDNPKNITTIITQRKKPQLSSDDMIVVPGTTVNLTLNTNNDINGKITIKIQNNTYTGNIQKGIMKYQLKIPSAWTQYYNKIIQVHFTYNGNNEYTSNEYTVNLYIQKNTSSFNLKNYGLLTNVKNQELAPSCWSFATIGALESAMLKQYNKSLDLSENNLKNLINKYSPLGLKILPNQGSSLVKAINYVISWNGIVNENQDPYFFESTVSPRSPSKIKVQDVTIIPNRKNLKDNNEIKKAILKYGAVISECYFDEKAYYNNDTNAILNWYTNNIIKPDHAILLVGWDDNYSRNHFGKIGNRPAGDGAFIIKNSYGTQTGDKGYNYISYYDTSLGGYNRTTISNLAFILGRTENYTTIYQQDIQSTSNLTNTTPIWISNRYTAINNEAIRAVGTYFINPTNYTISIYKNTTLQFRQNGEIINELGYRTIELNSMILVQKGDNFTVTIQLKSAGNTTIILQDQLDIMKHDKNTKSWISFDSKRWINLHDYNLTACIKVYAKKAMYSILTRQTWEKNLLVLRINTNITDKGNISYYINNKLIQTIPDISLTSNKFKYNINNSTKNILFTVKITAKYENLTQTLLINPTKTTVTNKNTLPSTIFTNNTVNMSSKFIEYTVTIPCYINLTLPKVIKTGNTTFDKYIVKNGTNGVIKVNTQRIITVLTQKNGYNFTNINDPKIKYTLNNKSYYVNLVNNSVTTCTNNYTPKTNGIIISYQKQNIIIKYYQQIINNINQFTMQSMTTDTTYNNTNKLPRTTNKLYNTLIIFNLNTAYTSSLRISEGINYDELGLKYQLYKQGKIKNYTKTNYLEIKNYTIKYTQTNEKVKFNTNKIIRENLIEDMKTTFKYQNNTCTRTEKIFINETSYILQTYTIVSVKLNKDIYNSWLNKQSEYNDPLIYLSTVLGLKTVYFNDLIATITQNMTGINWSRNTATTILIGFTDTSRYINCLNPNMAMNIKGNLSSVITFRLMTSLALSEIEYQVITGNIYSESFLSKITKEIEKGNYNLVEKDSSIYLITSNGKSIFTIDTKTGLISDYNFDGQNINHGVNLNDSTHTSFTHFEVGSEQAELERTAGNIVMTVGSTMLCVPGLTLPGIILIGTGLAISIDANGVFSGGYNYTRLSNVIIDFATSSVPYGKVFGIIETAGSVGLKFTELTRTITSATKGLFTGHDVIQGAIGAAVTFVSELATINDREGGIIGVVYDTVSNFIPSKTFTKQFTELPHLIGRQVKTISKEMKKHTDEAFKAIYDFDSAVKVSGGNLKEDVVKFLFMTYNTFGIISNQLIKHFVDKMLKGVITAQEYGYNLYRRINDSLNALYVDATYVATNSTGGYNSCYTFV